MHKQAFIHQDDHTDLTGDALADKVARYIRYVALIDTSHLAVIALGRTIILEGYVACEAEIGCVEEAATSVLGVHLVDNKLEVLPN